MIEPLLPGLRPPASLDAGNGTGLLIQPTALTRVRLSSDGSITQARGPSRTVLGHEAGELVGQSLFLFCHPEEVGAVRAALASVPTTPDGLTLEFRFRRGDGQFVWLHAVAVGEADEVLALFSDATERRQQDDQLRQAQKMAAVGWMAGGVAHDFNNLLTIIKGYAELLTGQLAPDDPKFRNVHEITKTVDRAAGLVRQVLTLVRNRAIEREVIDLNAVVADMDRMLRRLLGDDIDLVMALDTFARPIHADAGQVEQLVLNLATNARDAMPQGGQLFIETRDGWSPGASAVSPLSPFVQLTVRDTGIGMDETTRGRLFEPFFTTKEVGKGTGIGLTTVAGIVRQHGGHIEVESAPGRGTTFRAYLPAVGALTSREGTSAPARSETVLLVEEEAVGRLVAAGFLSRYGFQVLEARHPQDALELCRSHSGPIHLLLTEVMMPGMSGSRLAAGVQALRPELRVLYLSDASLNGLMRYGLSETESRYLRKPFTAEALARKVCEVLDEPAVTK